MDLVCVRCLVGSRPLPVSPSRCPDDRASRRWVSPGLAWLIPLLGNRVPRGRGGLDGEWARGREGPAPGGTPDSQGPAFRANVCEDEGHI